MTYSEPIPIMAKSTRARLTPLKSAFLVIYLSTAVLLLMEAQAVARWADDKESSFADFALSTVAPVAALSDRLGLSMIVDSLREQTKKWMQRPKQSFDEA